VTTGGSTRSSVGLVRCGQPAADTCWTAAAAGISLFHHPFLICSKFAQRYDVYAVVVCLSVCVCLSHSGIVSIKRLNV